MIAPFHRPANFPPDRSSILPPRPLKQPVRYPVPRPNGKPKPVTVCIAAICQENGEPRIVLCADTRLDASYAGSTDGNRKIFIVAHGWVALLSGDWEPARSIQLKLASLMQKKATPKNEAQIKAVLLQAVRAYTKTLIHQTADVEIILAGFVSRGPLIAVLGVPVSGDPVVQFFSTSAAVGSGAHIARVLLSLRDCKSADDLSSAVYVVYEAKKYSEKAAGVGPETWIKVIAPMPDSAHPDQVNFDNITPEFMAELEKSRSNMGLQPVYFPPIVKSDYQLSPTTSPYPQHPKDVPSPLPPSPESSVGSGES